MVNIPKKEERSILRLHWHLYSWERNTWDYKIIALCLDHFRDIDATIRFLDKANDFLLPGHNHIFDGTIKCLLYLIDNHMINIEFITDEDLRKLLLRFAKNPDDPIYIPISTASKSFQASTCKMVPIGIWLRRNKILIDPSCKEIINFFKTCTINDLKNPDGKMVSILNSLWIGWGSRPWNRDANQNISGFFQEKVVESFIPGTGLNKVFFHLQPIILGLCKEMVPDFYERHPIRIAIRHAATLVFYSALEHKPKSIKEDRSVWTDGGLDTFAEDVAWIIFTRNGKLRNWFKRYFEFEMRKRIKLIQATAIRDPEFLGDEVNRYFYFPVYEYFRFINKDYIERLFQYLVVFKSKSFTILEKDDIAKHIVFSIQNAVLSLMARENISGDSFDIDGDLYEPLKEVMEEFMLETLRPLIKNSLKKTAGYAQIRKRQAEDDEDIYQILYTELIIMLLEYDESLNNSLFGYLKVGLELRFISALRLKKIDRELICLPDNIEIKDESGSDIELNEDKIPLTERIDQIIRSLTPKQREVIEKSYFNNERLTETERKQKYRTLQKIKEQYPDLEDYLLTP
jgi:hypothetical protein